jgi:hypothetical protein
MRIALVVSLFALAGCAQTGPKVALEDKVPSVRYFDFNEDGKPDFELHYRGLWKGVVGYEWSRRDHNYDGYYDEQTDYGATISISKPIHMPVPPVKFTDWPDPDAAKRPNQPMQRTPTRRSPNISHD